MFGKKAHRQSVAPRCIPPTVPQEAWGGGIFELVAQSHRQHGFIVSFSPPQGRGHHHRKKGNFCTGVEMIKAGQFPPAVHPPGRIPQQLSQGIDPQVRQFRHHSFTAQYSTQGGIQIQHASTLSTLDSTKTRAIFLAGENPATSPENLDADLDGVDLAT